MKRANLRLWPGVVAVVVQWLGMFAIPLFGGNETKALGAAGGALCTLALVVWWVFFSRAPSLERWGGLALVIVAMAGTTPFLHRSVAEGNIGFQFFLYAIPVVSLAFVGWAVASRSLAEAPRRAALLATVLLSCGFWTLVRSRGITGDSSAEFAWRWAETSEERLLAGAPDVMSRPAHTAKDLEAEWPGFRGPGRDGVIPGVRIVTDWTTSPPVELWRRAIGPGVSSFAVRGDLLYTQEQRGEDEVVSSYDVRSGEPVWRHRDQARFWDSHVGAGPRATPTVRDGRVYAFGATGILNALGADDGSLVWSRDVASDTDAKLDMFGFTSSPLVVDDVVIVNTNQLVAYDLKTGEPRWFGPKSGSYSSPHLLTLDGVEQIVFISHGAKSVSPFDGTLLWEHEWPGVGIVQPALDRGRRHLDKHARQRRDAARYAPYLGRAHAGRMDGG